MWALIIEGLVQELTDEDPDGRFHESLVWVASGVDVRPGWSYVDEVFAAPPDNSRQVAWETLKGEAQAELDRSDRTVLRCFENAVPVPTEWAAYRNALRDIISAADIDGVQMPSMPQYPAGT